MSRCMVIAFALFVVPTFLLIVPPSAAQTQASCTFQLFNPPSGFSGDFFPMGVNHFKTVVGGAYTSNQNSEAGYTRFSGGGTSLFKAPHALFTQLNRRNASGVSVGQYSPAGQPGFPGPGSHGVMLTSNSQATLDYPGAGSTVLSGINKSNVIVGSALDTSTGGSFGFKHVNGKFSKIVFPHAVQTTTTAINDNGVIAGSYELGSFENPFSGYILQNGMFKSLSYIPADINNAGTIVSGNTIHLPNGAVKTVNVPSSNQTHVNGINDLGTITGAAHFGGTPGMWKGFTATCH
ncbi:MAG TPA: hypothetical protein VL156_00745 [Terriglobales bacterium]|jgi:hypothetical protein|nr:hypothetical protein [Terriglobales bacterium]